MDIIDLEQFEKAIISLHKILERYERENYDIDIRDAVIQRFEYTFALAVKTIIRFLQYDAPVNESAIGFNAAIRQANKLGILLTDLEQWSEYRKKRNLTSHTYKEETAQEVVSVVPAFKEDVDFLLMELKKRLS